MEIKRISNSERIIKAESKYFADQYVSVNIPQKGDEYISGLARYFSLQYLNNRIYVGQEIKEGEIKDGFRGENLLSKINKSLKKINYNDVRIVPDIINDKESIEFEYFMNYIAVVLPQEDFVTYGLYLAEKACLEKELAIVSQEVDSSNKDLNKYTTAIFNYEKKFIKSSANESERIKILTEQISYAYDQFLGIDKQNKKIIKDELLPGFNKIICRQNSVKSLSKEGKLIIEKIFLLYCALTGAYCNKNDLMFKSVQETDDWNISENVAADFARLISLNKKGEYQSAGELKGYCSEFVNLFTGALRTKPFQENNLIANPALLFHSRDKYSKRLHLLYYKPVSDIHMELSLQIGHLGLKLNLDPHNANYMDLTSIKDFISQDRVTVLDDSALKMSYYKNLINKLKLSSAQKLTAYSEIEKLHPRNVIWAHDHISLMIQGIGPKGNLLLSLGGKAEEGCWNFEIVKEMVKKYFNPDFFEYFGPLGAKIIRQLLQLILRARKYDIDNQEKYEQLLTSKSKQINNYFKLYSKRAEIYDEIHEGSYNYTKAVFIEFFGKEKGSQYLK